MWRLIIHNLERIISGQDSILGSDHFKGVNDASNDDSKKK